MQLFYQKAQQNTRNWRELKDSKIDLHCQLLSFSLVETLQHTLIFIASFYTVTMANLSEACPHCLHPTRIKQDDKNIRKSSSGACLPVAVKNSKLCSKVYCAIDFFSTDVQFCSMRIFRPEPQGFFECSDWSVISNFML